MKVSTSTIECIKITDIDNLDPITVYLEDIKPRHGKITIECWGRAWSALWCGMGERTIKEFFCHVDNDYLIGNLNRGIQMYIVDYDNMMDHFRDVLIKGRKQGLFKKDEARELWEEIEDDGEDGEPFLHTSSGSCLAARLLGDEWYMDLPTVKNHEYQYLERIVQAVKDEILQILENQNDK